jgi:hypothetical protein
MRKGNSHKVLLSSYLFLTHARTLFCSLRELCELAPNQVWKLIRVVFSYVRELENGYLMITDAHTI